MRVHLHFPESGSLKAKRAELNRVKAHLRRRMGASVAEVGGHDTWQRSTLAVAFAEARTTEFQGYAQQVADNAKSLAEGFLTRGANLVTGGTDNHIVLLDVSSFGLTGRQAESALLDAGVVTNRNSVPSDPNGAWYTSGIRFGTPALTAGGKAVGTLSTLGLAPLPASNNIGDMAKELAFAQANSGISGLTMVNGTEPFNPIL